MKLSLRRMAAPLLACAVAVSTCFAHAEGDAKPRTPIANVSLGWTYLWADEGDHYRSNLNGWFVHPAVNIGHGYAGFADFTNYYGKNSKGSVNSHGFTFGVSREFFEHGKIRPSVFAEAGDVRSSSAGTITNQLAIPVGFGFTVPIARWVSLSVTPAEYIFLYPKSDWRNDYNAKAGFSFPIGHH